MVVSTSTRLPSISGALGLSLVVHLVVIWAILRWPQASFEGQNQFARFSETGNSLMLGTATIAGEHWPDLVVTLGTFSGDGLRERHSPERAAPLAPQIVSVLDQPMTRHQRNVDMTSLTPPVPLTEIELDRAEINAQAQEGELQLRVWVEADGSASDVELVSPSNAPDLFVRQVSLAFRSARYAPATYQGLALRAALEVTVTTHLRFSVQSDMP